MKDNYLNDLCEYEEWVEVREFLDSDSTNKDKKREFVFYRGGDGMTCLHACLDEDAPPDIITSLLDIGGHELVMAKDSYGSTALHFACCGGASLDAIKTLIDLGGMELVMTKDEVGNTALHDLCYTTITHEKPADIIKLMLQVAGTERLLTDKNDFGKTPLDLATENQASDEVTALLLPQTIKNEPPIASDDTSNLVPDDQDNDITTTELHDQLQAANQKIADLETQRTDHLLLATKQQDQLQASNQKIADLEDEIKNQNVLLSEQKRTETQIQAAYQKKVADYDKMKQNIEIQQTEHLTTIAHLSTEKAKQDADITYWKGLFDNGSDICSEQKEEIQRLKDFIRVPVHANAKRDRDGDDNGDPATQSRSSKRSKVGSTTNVMHSYSDENEYEDAVEAVMQDLLHERHKHSDERQKHSKLMVQFLKVRRELSISKTQSGQQRNTDMEEVN